MSTEQSTTYLVLADVTVSSDGGHLMIQHAQYWVKAPTKQTAATACSRDLKKQAATLAVKIVRVVAIEQWGKEYFPVLCYDGFENL